MNRDFWIRIWLALLLLAPLEITLGLHGRPSQWFLLAGMLSNITVVWINGKKMPVQGQQEISERHQPLGRSTRLKLLCDIIPTPIGKASVGDLLISVGFVWSFVSAVRGVSKLWP